MESRSVYMEEMSYNPDGTIQNLPWWSETGAEQMGTLSPFIRNEAETMAGKKG